MRSSLLCSLLSTPFLLQAQSFQLAIGGPGHQEGIATMATGSAFITVVQDVGASAVVHPQLLITGTDGGGPTGVDIALQGRWFTQHAVPLDNDLLLCGSTIRPGRNDHDAFIARITVAGGVVWQWTSDTPEEEEQLLGLALTDDGEVIAAGMRRAGADSDGYLVRLDNGGALQWARHHGVASDEKLNGVAPSGAGFTAAGRITNAGGESDAYILRVDEQGEELEWQSWGDIADDAFQAVARSGEQVVMAGYSVDPTSPPNARRKRAYLMALNAAGDTLWTRTIADPTHGFSLHAITVADNGDLFVGGTSDREQRSDALVIRLTSTGMPLWQQTYHLQRHDVVRGITPLADGGLLATGRCFGPEGGQVLLLRKDASGN